MAEEVKKNDPNASGDEGVKNDDSKAPENHEGDVDYKAELEALTAKFMKSEEDKENYKQGMLSAKNLLKKKGGKADDNEDDDEDDSDKSELETLKERLSQIEKSSSLSTFDAMIGQFTSDPDEQNLIKFHFQNSVGSVGTIQERIENAQLIANKKKILKTSNEMKRSLENKTGVARFATGGGGNQDQEKGSKDFFSPEQIAILKKKGLDPEKVKENYLKLKQ